MHIPFQFLLKLFQIQFFFTKRGSRDQLRQKAYQIIWYTSGKTRGGKAQDICQEKALGFQLTSPQISIKMFNLNKKNLNSMVEQQRFPRPGNGIQ